MRKAIENDFARSGLAEQLFNVADQMTVKRETLLELKEAIESAEGELRHAVFGEQRDGVGGRAALL